MESEENISFEDAFLHQESTILEAIKIIDHTALQIALVVDDERHLLGSVTDGDIRRGILGGVKLEDSVSKVMNSSPHTIPPGTSRQKSRSIMLEYKIHQLPIVDDQGIILGLAQMDNVLSGPLSYEDRDDVWVVLMLGGMGTRLLPLTEGTPKPMLSIGDKPLLETIVGNFVSQGFKNFYFSVNYKADMIEDHFGDGSRFGINISYLHEQSRMGTAGALSLLPERPKGPIVIMNGDILTNNNFRHLVNFHCQNKASATMCVREYEQQVPYGIVTTIGTKLESITEKPSHSYFVNAGIYVIDPDVLDFVPQGQFFDMPQLFDELQKENLESSVFPIRDYWRDIGHHEDLERARSEYQEIFGQSE